MKAKEQGKVRYIGFTGHKHPEIHRRMLSQGFPFDTVQMPVNVLDAHWRSFEQEILPLCQQQGIGVIGMKRLPAATYQSGTNITTAEAIRYAMSLPISTLVSGMKSLNDLEQNLAVAQSFTPLTGEERAELLVRSAPAAQNGDYERFKTTRDYDANEGRVAHRHALVGAAG